MIGLVETAARDEALPPEALADRAVSKEISQAAVRLFLRIAERWDLSVEQRQTLLGGISRQTYYNWREGKAAALSRDQLERISLVLGIYKGLRLLFADDAGAWRWFTAGNRDLPFAGVSPLAAMLRGSIDDLYGVRRYIDAWRGMK